MKLSIDMQSIEITCDRTEKVPYHKLTTPTNYLRFAKLSFQKRKGGLDLAASF